jgi:gas vesicle protein
MKKAQKQMGRAQGSLSDTLQSSLSQTSDAVQTGLSAAQDFVGQSVQGAGKSLKQVQKSVQETQKSMKQQAARAARKRRRTKMVFRLGLLIGMAFVLLYTPWPGSETRQRLVDYWQGLFSNQ